MSDTLTAQRALNALAEDFECEATVESVARAIYKHTDCGAYFDIVGDVVQIGTIVEGSDAEYDDELALFDYDNDRAGAGSFASDVHAILSACEDFAQRQWDDDDQMDYELYDQIYGDDDLIW